MALHSNTLAVLVKRTAMLHLNDYTSGTATGGSTTTFVDTSRWENNDFFNNRNPLARIHIVITTDSLVPLGEERRITLWTLSTTTGTVNPAFSVAPGAGDTYAILYQWTWAEITEAINAAIDVVASEALVEKIDEASVALTAADYEYDVPTLFTHIYRLTMADGNGKFYTDPIPPDQYIIIRGAATPQIQFLQFPQEAAHANHYFGELWATNYLTASRKVRIEGYAKQAALTTDASVCYIDPVFVCAQAAAFLHANRIRRPDNEPDEHRTQMKVCQDIADKERMRMLTHFPPNIKRVSV